jgi:transcriptional regulator with XRE-family HTH domain
MIIPKKYVVVMDNRREAFSRALRYFIENGKNITQTRISKATGIKQGMISGMKTGKRYGTEESRREIAAFFGKPYEEFLQIGERLIDAESKAGLSGTAPTASEQPPATPHRRATDTGNMVTLSEHQIMVTRFKDKARGKYLNELLLEIEELDPGALDEVTGILKVKIDTLRKRTSPRQSPQDKSSAS